jgi:hypothetical protein
MFEQVQELVTQATQRFSTLTEKIKEYNKIELSSANKINFAKKTIAMHWGEKSVIEPEQLLLPRRPEDEKNDLFTVYNVIQENVIKGGVEYRHNESIRHTRKITGVGTDYKVNSGLWDIMVNFAEKGFFN